MLCQQFFPAMLSTIIEEGPGKPGGTERMGRISCWSILMMQIYWNIIKKS
jgi:hypothetical protein